MSKLDELIQELCPDGVEYKKIKEVYKRIKGTPITAAKMKEIADDNGDVKIFAGGKTIVYAFEKDIPNANITRIPAVLVQSRGVIDVVYYDLPFTFKNEMWAYTHENPITLKFLYYVLKNNINKFRDEAAGMGSMPQISLKVTEDFNMPVPPLEVQQEIVHLLDDFTAKTAELQTELNKEYEACKKQYEYYQNLLLNDKFGAEYKELGDVVTFLNGRAYKQSELLNSGKYKVLRVGNFYTNNQWYYSDLELEQNKYCQKGDLLYTWAATIGPQIWNGEKVIYHYHIWKLVFDNSILNMHYLYHYLKKDINDISNSLTNSTMPHVSMSSMKKRMISIPPMETQQEIVRLLDNLTEKTEELQDKLNEELESRQKQYEYYRDKLLTFKELK